jgi:hypothetical protein
LEKLDETSEKFAKYLTNSLEKLAGPAEPLRRRDVILNFNEWFT